MVYESHEWVLSICGDIEEELPSDMPIPLGKFVRTYLFCNANLYHDLVAGGAMTGILHLVNQTPINGTVKSWSL